MAELFAVVTPGLETISRTELIRLGVTPQQVETGGIYFEGGLEDIYRCNLNMRTVTRLLVRFGRFHAAAFSELRKKAGRLDWETFINPDQPVHVRSSSHKSRLFHSDAISERVMGAIADRLGFSPREHTPSENDDPPNQLILVRLVNNVCTISLDTSGDPLYKRGYRLDSAKAPLRETHAAAMLIASGWDGTLPLIDPFCGSGTIPIEAACMAGGIAPGLNRDFSFMRWPGFDSNQWRLLLEQAESARTNSIPLLFGADRDQGAITASQANAHRAGVDGQVHFQCQALSALIAPAGPGHLVTNPPFGIRLTSSQDIRNLYAQIGHVFREQCRNWQVTMISSAIQLLAQTGFELDTSLKFTNGGMNVILAKGMVS